MMILGAASIARYSTWFWTNEPNDPIEGKCRWWIALADIGGFIGGALATGNPIGGVICGAICSGGAAILGG